MKTKIRWGILGTATIAKEQVVPAIIESDHGEVLAIASRSAEKAKKVAAIYQIKRYYDGYQELLDDNEIDAVYIPLPNHLHVEWAIKALRAGKHVLVEKPIALSSGEARRLLEEAKKHSALKVMEAFMYKFHPQWIQVKDMVDRGEIGQLKTIQASFSFFDADLGSIVNIKEYGGGSLRDIGCYPISISRFLFGAEPKSVVSSIEYHPETKVDILASGILEFEDGQANFFSGTQLIENQQVHIFGTEGSIEFEVPFNPPLDKTVKIWLFKEDVRKEIAFEACNQYVLQIDAFNRAILEDNEVPVSLEDGIRNMIVIEKLEESNSMGKAIPL